MMNGDYTLNILHASDQEAGVPALKDAIGFSAVLNRLEEGYNNTIKLTSGDLFIAGPFFDASRDLYDTQGDAAPEPAGRQGLADILLQNAFGWDAAAVGNHEFDAGPATFLGLLAADAGLVDGAGGGQGLGDDGYPGAAFPYLAANLDFSAEVVPDGVSIVESGGAPAANSISGSVVVDVNGEPIGVVAAVTPYLPSIAGIGAVTMETGDDILPTTPIDDQVNALIANLEPEVGALTEAGITKIILMTHLQEAPIEQALAAALAARDIPVDVVIGGGSHRVMANSADAPPLRDDETQQDTGQLLQPYPQVFADDDSTVFYVNTDANYRYLSQLVVTFDDAGVISAIGDDSGTHGTDLSGVARLYGEDQVQSFDDVRALADPDVVAIVDGVAAFINERDGTVFGQTDVFLNGTRGDVRTQETNLGSLAADAQLFYAQQYLDAFGDAVLAGAETIDFSFKNGGGIRDNIGQSFIAGGGSELVQTPPAANPEVGKEEGDISELDISNSLRFNNDLVVGTMTAQDLFDTVEHMVSAVELTSGRFGQIGGGAFSYDPDAAPGDRVQSFVLTNPDGSVRAVIAEDGELVIDPDQPFSVVTLGFLAAGGDGFPTVLQDQVALSTLAEPDSLGRADLIAGGEQDALAEFLAAFHDAENGQAPFAVADTGQELDQRIQNLTVREDTVLDGIGQEIAADPLADMLIAA